MIDEEGDNIDPGRYSVKELLKKNYWDNKELKENVRDILEKIDAVVKNWEEKHDDLQKKYTDLSLEFENEKGKKAGMAWLLGAIGVIITVVQFFIWIQSNGNG